MQKLSTLLAAVALLIPASTKAAVDFQGPDISVQEGGPQFAAPFTIDHSDGLTSFQFTVTWDPSVVQFQSAVANPLFPTGFGFNPGVGSLAVSWSSGTALAGWSPEQPAYTLNFVPSGSAGNSTSLGFSGAVLPVQVTINSVPGQLGTDFNLLPGSITVVPEPINVALGTFAGLVLCVGAVRKYRNRKSA